MKYILVIGDGMADNPVPEPEWADAASGGSHPHHRRTGGPRHCGPCGQLPKAAARRQRDGDPLYFRL